MSTTDPTSLERLHDVVAPPPVPWWPPAPGWYWVIGIVSVFTIYMLVRSIIRWQHNRYRREALSAWREQSALLDGTDSRTAALAALADVLKRAALSAYPRAQVAALTGPAWLGFLDRTASMNGFDSDAGDLLERAAYGTAGQVEQARAREAAALVRTWLIRHRADHTHSGGDA